MLQNPPSRVQGSRGPVVANIPQSRSRVAVAPCALQNGARTSLGASGVIAAGHMEVHDTVRVSHGKVLPFRWARSSVAEHRHKVWEPGVAVAAVDAERNGGLGALPIFGFDIEFCWYE